MQSERPLNTARSRLLLTTQFVYKQKLSNFLFGYLVKLLTQCRIMMKFPQALKCKGLFKPVGGAKRRRKDGRNAEKN